MGTPQDAQRVVLSRTAAPLLTLTAWLGAGPRWQQRLHSHSLVRCQCPARADNWERVSDWLTFNQVLL